MVVKIPFLRGADDYWALLCARPGSKSNSFHPLKEVFPDIQIHSSSLMSHQGLGRLREEELEIREGKHCIHRHDYKGEAKGTGWGDQRQL